MTHIGKGSPAAEFLWPKVQLDFDDGNLAHTKANMI